METFTPINTTVAVIQTFPKLLFFKFKLNKLWNPWSVV